MITREEFLKFLKSVEGLPEDTAKFNVDFKLAQLIEDNKVGIVINDWKATTQQFKDVAEMLAKVKGGFVHHFGSFYNFPSGSSGDDLVTVVSDKEITFEHAEAIADLYYNFGAESSNLI